MTTKKCCAKRFQYVTKGLCCCDGLVKLAEQETLPELMRLWTSSDDNVKHFRDHIRWFNGHFSFTSLYCNLDQDTTNLRKHSIYTFRAHGQMYHNIHDFGKQDGIDSSHLELYFYDDDPALEHHFSQMQDGSTAKG
jgi:hypothetical protein